MEETISREVSLWSYVPYKLVDPEKAELVGGQVAFLHVLMAKRRILAGFEQAAEIVKKGAKIDYFRNVISKSFSFSQLRL